MSPNSFDEADGAKVIRLLRKTWGSNWCRNAEVPVDSPQLTSRYEGDEISAISSFTTAGLKNCPTRRDANGIDAKRHLAHRWVPRVESDREDCYE